MSDYWVKEAERRGDEAYDYGVWIEQNEDFIIESYQNTDPEAPEDIYECVVDDDYPEAYDSWLESLSIDDVPDDFISDMYEWFLEDED